MSKAPTPPYKPDGPIRAPGAAAVRPRGAATLIIVRGDGATPRVLMGKRHSDHRFMPNLWVFPGGRVERADHRAPHGTGLRHEVRATFDAHLPPGRGQALALAAIRETFEETGLLLAKPAPPKPGAGPWSDFLAQGAAPDLEAIEIVARAITPPMVAKRYDTWFLTARAERLMSLERQPDCGELAEIAWLEFEEALALPLAGVTRSIIREAVARLDDPNRPQPYMRFRGGRWSTGQL